MRKITIEIEAENVGKVVLRPGDAVYYTEGGVGKVKTLGRCPKYGGRPTKCRRCGVAPLFKKNFCLECHRCTRCCERSKGESRD